MAKSFTDYVQTVIVKKGLTGLFQCLVMRSSPFLIHIHNKEATFTLDIIIQA